MVAVNLLCYGGIMKKKLYWKEITSDGLLKEPEEIGPHYGKESLNWWGGFDTEDEAIAHFEQMKKAHEYSIYGDYVLMTIYSP